jgi:hypothetical protein
MHANTGPHPAAAPHTTTPSFTVASTTATICLRPAPAVHRDTARHRTGRPRLTHVCVWWCGSRSRACVRERVNCVRRCVTEGGEPGAPRTVAFGAFAGRAGMIGGLRGLGERALNLVGRRPLFPFRCACLSAGPFGLRLTQAARVLVMKLRGAGQGYSTPFLSMGSAYMYPDLSAGQEAICRVGEAIRGAGLCVPVFFWSSPACPCVPSQHSQPLLEPMCVQPLPARRA